MVKRWSSLLIVAQLACATAAHKPSTESNAYFVSAHEVRPSHRWTRSSGKWLIFVPPEQVDETWERIRMATEAGQLGLAAKASTARPNPHARSRDRVIVVYTYDGSDLQDRTRVRRALRQMGFTEPLCYKTDEATRKGIYSPNLADECLVME